MRLSLEFFVDYSLSVPFQTRLGMTHLTGGCKFVLMSAFSQSVYMDAEREQVSGTAVPEVWKKCVLKGFGANITEAADAAMMYELSRRIRKYIRGEFDREAVVFEPNEPAAEVCVLVQKAVEASTRAERDVLDRMEDLMAYIKVRYGVIAQFNFQETTISFGHPTINIAEFPAFLAKLAEKFPTLEIAWEKQ